MDSMRNYQFEEEYDGSAVEADVAAFWRAKVAGIDSGHELRSDWLEPAYPCAGMAQPPPAASQIRSTMRRARVTRSTRTSVTSTMLSCSLAARSSRLPSGSMRRSGRC